MSILGQRLPTGSEDRIIFCFEKSDTTNLIPDFLKTGENREGC